MDTDHFIKLAPLISAIAMSVSFLIALILGIFQIVHMNRRQRQQTARAIFSDFIKTSMTYPVFAYPPGFADRYNFDKEEIEGSREKLEQYEWYISALLIASREVMETLRHDIYWRHRVRRNLRYHAEYFAWRKKTVEIDHEDFVFNSGRYLLEEIERVISDHNAKLAK